ncbi:predicted protein [Chaetoceros tenuissimus]|uniref:Uncharacterized protein n=1 Tax=Chaetoceros tenuissimus TaxID=426638 RepID=A0AAD3GZD7_9STRA|nr:predicted protein [Chaetoceros tenuissimus]
MSNAVKSPSESEGVGIANIAKSVTTLAQAVSDLQGQLRAIEQRLSEYESTRVINSERDARRKKAEFVKAYKAVVAIMKQLTALKEQKTIHEEETNTTCQHTNSSFNTDRNAQLLRNIAMTLSEMESVASYVSRDDISTAAASTISRPADYVKIERTDSPHDTCDKSTSEDINALKQLLLEKDEQMKNMLQETKLQSELLSNRSFRWIQIQSITIMLVVGGILIGNNYNLFQNSNGVSIDVSAEGQLKEPLHETFETTTESDESQETEGHVLVEIEDEVVNADSEDESNPPESLNSSEKTMEINTYNELKMDSIEENDEVNSTVDMEQSDEVSVFTAVEVESPIAMQEVKNNDEKAEQANVDKLQQDIIYRSWLERELCDELDDMMDCSKEKVQTRNVMKSLKSTDVQSLQRLMIKRQIFTALGVAAAMTLPKIAPHIFKISLKQILSISFWRSLMEFLTVLFQ